jgi:methionine-rich copper-binding protein CopC
VLSPSAATAHSNAVETNPEDGATVEQLPAEATVTFSEEPQHADVVLARPDGKTDKLKSQIAGSSVRIQLPAEGPRGAYTLSYRVVSADGHPVSGSTTFTVTMGHQPSAPTTSNPDEVEPMPPVKSGRGSGLDASVLAMAGGAALIALAAGLIFWLMRR